MSDEFKEQRISELRVQLHRIGVSADRFRATARQYREHPETRHPDPEIAEMFAQTNDRWADDRDRQAKIVRQRLGFLEEKPPEEVAAECTDHGLYFVPQCPGCVYAERFQEVNRMYLGQVPNFQIRE